jgi:hypothetical protein
LLPNFWHCAGLPSTFTGSCKSFWLLPNRQRFSEGSLIFKRSEEETLFMSAGMRDRLVGAWKLISYEERPVDGSPFFYPMTKKPLGIIIYTPDGFMSAQLMHPNRKRFASGDWNKGTDEEYRQEASTYIAYSGPFHVDEEQKTLTHSMFVSLFPNWLGQTQPRVVRIEGDDLYLSTATPVPSHGKIVNTHLHWKRASKV